MKVDVLFLLTKSIPVFVKAHYCKYPLNLAWLWAICMYIYIYIYIYMVYLKKMLVTVWYRVW